MRANPRPLFVRAVLILTAPWLVADDDVSHVRDVRPILSQKCFACHGPDKSARKARLRLDVRDSAVRVLGGSEPGASELLGRISSNDPDEVMPPPESHKKITPAEANTLRRWIAQGAPYAAHWAFRPPRRPDLPDVEDRDWETNAIDRLVLARIEAQNGHPCSPADPVTLIRRATFDLTGLPPTPDEVDAFLADDSPEAFEKVIDRLITSPGYGEHGAAAWLDAARYADTDGYQNDRYRYQNVWRDWIILALNDGQPFDEFVVEQIAGDMIPGATLMQQIASGFGRNHRINSEAGSIEAEWRAEYVADRVDTLGTMFLGLTVGCARCHDHKYDPISQTEYYRLFAYFNNVPEFGVGPNNGNSPPFIKVPKSWPLLRDEENRKIVPDVMKFQKNTYGGGVVRPKPGGTDTVMVMAELAEPRTTYLLKRGRYDAPDRTRELTPGVPASLDIVPGPKPTNRLELARWLVHPANALTARVTVNGLWQRIFGVGLVKTSENFGSRGEPPSHPLLLDWLAVELVDSGWDVRSLVRKILLSSTYRQASSAARESFIEDPQNRLLARGPRFRLSAFAIRDQSLQSSGLLARKIGGPSAKPYMPPKIWRSISNNKYTQDHGEQLYRRSLYTYWRRTIPPPTMVSFDAAEREVCVIRKDRTNTPLQALTLMNNVAFVEASRFLASRMMREGGEDAESRIAFGFRLTTGRRPDAAESSMLASAHLSFLARFGSAPDAAKKLLAVGEKKRDAAIDPTEHAAMTMLGSLLLNLDETITKE